MEYRRLMEAFYKGEISIKEEEELYLALDKDASLKEQFLEMETNYSFIANKNTRSNWDAVQLKMDKIYPSLENRRKEIYTRYLKFAAVFVFGMTAYWFVNFLSQEIESTTSKDAYYEMIVPKGQKSELVLPDGTYVWLNSESRLKYPVNFSIDDRKVELVGEGFFKVTKQNQKDFWVQTKDFDIKVTGTEFNVMAYADFGRTEASLEKGKIEIYKSLDSSSPKIAELSPSQKIIYSEQNKNFSVIKSNPKVESSWKRNEFVFEDLPFSEFAKRLERWYNVEITFTDPELSSIKYTGQFKNKETIWQVLDIIKLTTNIDYTLNDRKLIIKRRNK